MPEERAALLRLRLRLVRRMPRICRREAVELRRRAPSDSSAPAARPSSAPSTPCGSRSRTCGECRSRAPSRSASARSGADRTSRLSSTLTRSLPAPSCRTRSTSRCALRIDGTSGLVDEEHRVGGIERRRPRTTLIDVAGVDDDVVVDAAEHAQQLLDRAGVLRVRPVELLASRRGCRGRTCASTTSSREEVLVEAVQVLDRVEHREARPHAEEQRHFAEARLQVDDDRRPLRQPRQLDRAVHRDRRRAGAALGAEEDVRDARLLARRRWSPRGAPRSAARRRGRTPPSRARPAVCPPASRGRTRWRRRASPAGSARDPAAAAIAKIATALWLARSRSIAAMPDEASARMSTTTTSGARRPCACLSTMPTGHPARPQQPATWRLNSSSWLTMDAASCAMEPSILPDQLEA